MARIVVASAAYLGDVAPFVGPANRLTDRGHDVTFLVPAGFHSLLARERFGLATYPLDFSPSGMRADPTHQRLMRHPWANQVRLVRYWMRRGLVGDVETGRDAVLRTLKGADLLVTHPTFGCVTIPAADHLGIPAVVGHLFPMMIPTAAWGPPIPVKSRDFGAGLNRLAWRATIRGSGAAFYDRAMNRYRRSLGVGSQRGTALVSWAEAARTVILVSRHYFGDEPSDWDGWHLQGFSAWEGPTGQQPDERVEEFVDDGGPPVLVCLGTSAAAGAGSAFAAMATGLQQRGLRALLLVGDPANLEHVRDVPGAFEFAPVPAVVGRCSAAVVSGALGTLAAALTAGVPVVVLPQLFDQVWHGRRVEDLGVGIMVTRPSKVPAAVATLLSDPAYAERARSLGAKLRAEDGAGALVEAVESAL